MYAQPDRDALGVRWPVGAFTLRVRRRHVDLVRVSSAQCRAAKRLAVGLLLTQSIY
jgi:hypothetical protein